MPDFKLFLGMIASGKWHVLDPDGNILAECDSQKQAMEKVSEMLGDGWKSMLLHDEIKDGVAEAMLEQRGKAVN
jgi:hypothetical protein